MLNASVKSLGGILAKSCSKSNCRKETFRFHDLLLCTAIFNNSASLSIPINSHSDGRSWFKTSNHSPDAHPKSTILFGASLDNL